MTSNHYLMDIEQKVVMELSLRSQFTTPELLQLLQYRKDGKSYCQIAALLRGHSKVECQKIRQEIENGMRDQQQSYDVITESMRWSHHLQQIVDGQSDRQFPSQQPDYHSKTHDRATGTRAADDTHEQKVRYRNPFHLQTPNFSANTSTSQGSLLETGYHDSGSLHKLAQNKKDCKLKVAGSLAWNDNEDNCDVQSAPKISTNQTKSPNKTLETIHMGKGRNKIQISALVHPTVSCREDRS